MITQHLLLFSIFIALALLCFTIFQLKTKDAPPEKKQLILYLLAGGLLIGITGMLGFINFTKLPPGVLIGAMGWMLFIGILHTWLYEKFFVPNITGKILLTLALFFFGYSLIFLLYKLVIRVPFPMVFFSPGFCFLAPMFTSIAFEHFTDIPVRLFKAWNFPPPGSLSDPSDREMADPIIINFEIRKGPDDNLTVFKAKAPEGMQLGRLFYYFVMDYNSRYPGNPVVLSEGEGSYFNWSFFMTGSIFSGKIYPDPDLTILENKIKENSSITCERIVS